MATKNKSGNTQGNPSSKNDKRSSSSNERRSSNGNTSNSNGNSFSGSKEGENKGLKELFTHQLADLYYVEQQLLQHLPKMAEAAQNEELKQAFTDHLKETEGHVKHLDAIFKELGQEPKAQKCDGIDGILKEGQQLMQQFKGKDALDAALVCAAQKVEHYEITSYGSLCAFAEQLGMDSVCDRIEEILDQEKAADEHLSELAEQTLNMEADSDSGEESEDEHSEEGENATRKETATA